MLRNCQQSHQTHTGHRGPDAHTEHAWESRRQQWLRRPLVCLYLWRTFIHFLHFLIHHYYFCYHYIISINIIIICCDGGVFPSCFCRGRDTANLMWDTSITLIDLCLSVMPWSHTPPFPTTRGAPALQTPSTAQPTRAATPSVMSGPAKLSTWSLSTWNGTAPTTTKVYPWHGFHSTGFICNWNKSWLIDWLQSCARPWGPGGSFQHAPGQRVCRDWLWECRGSSVVRLRLRFPVILHAGCLCSSADLLLKSV